jgi:L-amino acid N-acyltransferase YncA
MAENDILIRAAREDDAGALLAIYAPYVTGTAITFEYEVPSLDEFRARIRGTIERYPYLVAENSGKIVGYAYAGAFHARAAYDWAVETSIYVDKNHQGHGLGRSLYRALEDALCRQHIINLNACIAYTEGEDIHLTDASVKFHERLGYRMAGRFTKCGYKFGKWYDIVWMEKHLGAHPENPHPVIPFAEIRDK